MIMPHSGLREIKPEYASTRPSEASVGDEKGTGDLKLCFVGGCFSPTNFTASLSVSGQLSRDSCCDRRYGLANFANR